MHDAAMQWVRECAPLDALAVLDLGGRDVNGTPRALFDAAEVYRVLDIAPGPGVDIVEDAATWVPDRAYDVVVCTEVFEHTPAWRDLVRTAWSALRPGGVLVATMAGPLRAPHSAVDGGQVRPGEHYANIEPTQLEVWLQTCGFAGVLVDLADADVRCRAVRP